MGEVSNLGERPDGLGEGPAPAHGDWVSLKAEHNDIKTYICDFMEGPHFHWHTNNTWNSCLNSDF